MIACLYSPGPEERPIEALVSVARDFSPRVEVHESRLVAVDVSGLGRLLGTPRAIGEELQRSMTACDIRAHVAVAASRIAAALLACAKPGLTVIAPGQEATALAPLPLQVLELAARMLGAPSPDPDDVFTTLRRWGLKTLGDLGRLPAAQLSERLGEAGLAWQRLATGHDSRPLVPSPPDEQFEETTDLEWPVEGLEPLSFILGRLFDPLCDRLERCDRGAAAIHIALGLVTRDTHQRSLQLPAPLRDPRVFRTLVLLDLESHPPPAGIDRITVAIDPTPARVLQFSLLHRARPSAERLTTLLARLSALMGEDRVGSPQLVDSHRPGAFAMTRFEGEEPQGPGSKAQGFRPRAKGPRPEAQGSLEDPHVALRRFRLPIPARVSVEQGRPVRVTTDRRGFGGGAVAISAGPWRTSGEWWRTTGSGRRKTSWNRDEWDVALADGSAYRISCDRDQGRWMVDAALD